MTLRIKAIITAATLAALTLVMAVSVSLASPSPANSNTTRTNVTPAITYFEHFRCYIPRSGTTQCGRAFRMRPGRYVGVHLRYSGHKRVNFTLVDGDSGHHYASTSLLPGQTAYRVWRNNTGTTQYVYFDASTPFYVVVRVQADGDYIFHG